MADPEVPTNSTFLTAGNDEGVPFPEDDMDGAHVSESTRLHKKMREMKEMDDKLAAMKQDYARRIRLVKQGEARFLERQKNTIEYLRKFKQFIIETDSKRTRAEKKEAEERRTIEQKLKQIHQLTEQLAEKRKTRDRKLQQHERIKQNQTYLDTVLNNSDQYTEIDELLTRYKILEDTNKDLQKKAEEVAHDQEDTQHHKQKLTHGTQNDILNKNSQLARLLKVLEDISNVSSSLENDVVSAEDKYKDLNRTFGEIEMAIRNIHSRIVNKYPTSQGLRRQQERAAQQTREMEAKRDADAKGKPEGARGDIDEVVLKDLMELLETVAEKTSDMTYVVASVKESKVKDSGASRQVYNNLQATQTKEEQRRKDREKEKPPEDGQTDLKGSLRSIEL